MNARRVDKFSIMLSVLVFFSGHCWAESWQQTASARLTTEFDTNPLMSPTYTGGVWREIFGPSYSLRGTFDEDELNTGLALLIERSSNATLSPYRESPSVFADWLRRINAGEFGISSRYAEMATRYADIDSTGFVQVASTRTSRSLSGNLSQTVSERSTFLADVLFESVSYDRGTYIDYATRSATMTFNYSWSELSTTYVRLYHVDYMPTGVGSATQLTSANLGWNWKTSDSLEGTLELGKSRMSDAGMGTLYMASARYTGQRNVLILDASRQLSPSGVGGFVTVDQTNAHWSYDLNEDSRVGIDLGWRNSQFITDIINRTAGAWLQQDLNSYWGLRTYYRYNMLNGGLGDGATSNILGITLTYTHSDF